jgi:hypothetical protein
MRCRIRSRLSDFLLDALLLDTEESNETFLEVWEFFHILDIFKFSNMLVVPQNSFLSFDGKPFQVHPSSSGVSLETTE